MRACHGGNVWQSGRPADWLDFSANLNPVGPPDWARQALAAGLERARWYPDPDMAAATAGLAAHLGVDAACVLPTDGGIGAAALAAGLAGRCAIVQPTFQEYARLCGEHRDVSWEKLSDYAPKAGERLWLCNPNNPTGAALRRDEVLALLARVERAGGAMVVDEAFIHYCPERSVAGDVADHPALVVLGSLTKALALPGIRLGYLAAHPAVIATLREQMPPWRLNCLADAVAAALPGHGAYFGEMRALNAARRSEFAASLEALGARVYPSEANFLLCDFGRDMRPAIERLRQRRILARPCGRFPGLTDGHIRLAVKTEAENAALIGALKEALHA